MLFSRQILTIHTNFVCETNNLRFQLNEYSNLSQPAADQSCFRWKLVRSIVCCFSISWLNIIIIIWISLRKMKEREINIIAFIAHVIISYYIQIFHLTCVPADWCNWYVVITIYMAGSYVNINFGLFFWRHWTTA